MQIRWKRSLFSNFDMSERKGDEVHKLKKLTKTDNIEKE